MSYKTNLIKLAIKLTPIPLVLWVANIILKGIAQIKVFSLDIDTRQMHTGILLFGETESIEIWLEDFYILSNAPTHQLLIQQARSNKPWLNNILAHITGKPWNIPEILAYKAQISLMSELLAPRDIEG